MQHAYWAPLSAFAATLLTVAWLSRSRLSQLALDRPNQRSLHAAPTPRTGGIGIHVGIGMAWIMIAPGLPAALWLGVWLLVVVSLIDDMRGLPAWWRLATHLLAACVLVYGLLPEGYDMMVLLAVILAVTWMTNLYNFMDGSDGLAGGMALFGFSCYGAGAGMAGDGATALLAFSIAAAAAAFLVFNFHPARIFLGDIGSVPLGFLAAAFGLVGWLRHYWPWWFPVLVFSPFILDASVTLVRRIATGERVWEAHREHYYQRLVQLGWGHRGTALAEYAVMIASGLVALAVISASAAAQAAVLIAAIAVYAVLMVWIELEWRRRQTSGNRARS